MKFIQRIKNLFAKKGNISDGCHTFDELYDFRMLYNAALFNEWAHSGKYKVTKSRYHSDGELCFGGEWFIVTAILKSGQISNHYPLLYWNLFDVEEVSRPIRFDGHTAKDVRNRLQHEIVTEIESKKD